MIGKSMIHFVWNFVIFQTCKKKTIFYCCRDDLEFVPYMEKLFHEEALLGRGWTVNKTLRPLAYSTLADLVHHVRQHLSLCDLNRAVMFFSCHVLDQSLPLNIQTMSCKLLFNLVESIRLQSEVEGGNGRETLMRMLEVLVYKLKIITRIHIPYFLEQNKKNADKAPPVAGKPEVVGPENAEDFFAKQLATEEKHEEVNRRLCFPLAPIMKYYSLTECQALVKTIVCTVKTISWEVASCTNPNRGTAANTPPQYKQLTAKEIEVYLNLIKWGLKALDIYAINGPTVNATGQQTPQHPINTQGVRSKEEKEVLERFAEVFTHLNSYSLRELFAVSIDTLVQRIHENNAIQVFANKLLANSTTSAVFATILMEYLLLKMPEMGDDVEKSNLYLKLFKIVFGSVNLFFAENEKILRPHLKDIVNRSMELALTAKDPHNYFLLLRALFRCVGVGSHDLLYQEFLPLLPSLLQGLNSLQSGFHKHHMKDLFVELCLNVPVRLSSLLPYLPMLMNPLVSALNGSTTLISQGLRTLEMCVDNLHSEFLHEVIQPVRAELMHALWRTLRNANSSTAVTAFRILGKFGGSNREMLLEPLKLDYTDKTISGQCLTLAFQDHKESIALPIDKILEVALQTLRSLNPSLDPFYKKQAWEIVKGFIMSSIVIENERFVPHKIILDGKMIEGEIGAAQRPVFTDEKCRSTLTMGIAGIFVAVCVKELRREVYVFMIPFIRHIALIIVSQETGPFFGKMSNMDPYVFFDAMAQVLANEERDLKKTVLVGLSILMNCIVNIVRSKDRACALPMIEYLTEKMCNLCYEQAHYTKMGGCQAISFFLENMSLRWILSYQFKIIKTMYFVLSDLTGEISAGALDIARENLAKIIRICATCSDDNLHVLKLKSLHEMTMEFVKHLTSPNTNIRNQSMRGLELLAEHQSKTVSAILEPHKDVLIDMVPPKKHLIRYYSIQSQLGLLDGNTFCLNLQPKIFILDLNVIEHSQFVSKLTTICEAEDHALAKLPCYKNVRNLTPVKMGIMRVVARVARFNEEGTLTKEKIVSLFVKGMASANSDLMNCAFECLQKFMQEHTVEMEIQANALRPILSALSNMKTVTKQVLTQLSFLYQLFPGLYTDKVWERLLQILRKFLELALLVHIKTPNRTGVHELKMAVAVVSLFSLLPPSNTRFLEPLVKLCLNAEKSLLLGKGCPLRQPLIKFILRQPQQYLELVFAMPYLNNPEWNRFFIDFIQQDDVHVLRQCLLEKQAKLIYCLNIKKNPTIPPIPPYVLNNGANNSSAVPPTTNNSTPATAEIAPILPPTFSKNEQNNIQYLAVKAMTILNEFDEDWILANSGEVVQALRDLWESNDYQELSRINICDLPASPSAMVISNPPPDISTPPSNSPDSGEGTLDDPTVTVQAQTFTATTWSKLQVQTWEESEMIAKLLLTYYRKNPDDIDMLFKLLLAYCGKGISQFQFLTDFLENTVSRYSVQWKRVAFFQFVSVFQDQSYPEELKAKIIQYILIPCMAYSFEKGEGDELMGTEPMPDRDNPDNIVSVFLSQVIDPENPNTMPDSVRILLCQLSCVLVEQASAHIHDASNLKQGNKLKGLMTFAWPSLLSKTCMDSSAKYYGHLLLSHIIAKFAIHKRIVLQVFHSLLTASALEAKNVVSQALEIITPALPLRMEDGNEMLLHWTKKILLEEGHSLSQLMHLLQIIIRHWRVYYPVRHMLIVHMVTAIQRLGFTPTSTFEHRKLAVETVEVVIKWELERIRNKDEACGNDEKKLEMSSSTLINTTKAIEKTHRDSVVNFLLRLACLVNEPIVTSRSPGEILSKLCVNLVKTVLKLDVWADCDLQLSWFDILFATIESPQVNIPNINTAFELMTFIVGILSKECVLMNMKLLYKGIAACLNSPNSETIRSVQTFMSKLMSIFPTEFPGSSCSALQRYDELEPLYVNVSKIVFEGLNNYEKVPDTSAESLLGALMMCKSACASNPCYIDRIITLFMKALQRLARQHLNPGEATTTTNVITELLILSLDLVKNRVGVMGVEMRKVFIGTVLVSLIEKSTDTKIIQSIIKMLEEWVSNKNCVVINQGPSLREKSILLVKLMQNVEKRFSTDNHIVESFFELINFIYRDEQLKDGELSAKLEHAFLAGLRCAQPLIRTKFFEVFDASIRRRLHDRIMYILCSQNWEAMGPHYWIKQCAELLLSTAIMDAKVDLTPKEAIIPGIAHNIYTADARAPKTFLKVELMDCELPFIQQLENDVEALETLDENDEDSVTKVIARMEDAFLREGWRDPSHPVINVKMILLKEKDFGNIISGSRLSTFVQSVIQLIHLDTNLAEKVWKSFLPRAWTIFSDKQQTAIANEIVQFLCSDVHILQQTCHPSPINTFVESLSSFVPAVQIKPYALYYLAKTHNLWHRMTLLLEEMALDNGLTPQLKTKNYLAGDCYDVESNAPPMNSPSQSSVQQQEILQSLSELYSILREEDLWAGMWQCKARYPETNTAIAFEIQGCYEKAQGAYELAMSMSKANLQSSIGTMSVFSELKLWEDHWIRCCKELNQWDIVQEYCASTAGSNPMMVLESAWRAPDWLLMKETLKQVEMGCPKDQAWKVSMYQGYVAMLCSEEDKDLTTKVDRYVEGAQALCIKEWRRLPALISNVHIEVLQAAQMLKPLQSQKLDNVRTQVVALYDVDDDMDNIVELQESTQIHQGLDQFLPGSLHDVKSIVKTWRNRSPCISDDFSHWSNVFTWRQQHYQYIASHFDALNDPDGNHTMLGVHASAQVKEALKNIKGWGF